MNIEKHNIETVMPFGYRILKLERETILGKFYKVKNTNLTNEENPNSQKNHNHNNFILQISYEKLLALQGLRNQLERLKQEFLTQTPSLHALDLKDCIEENKSIYLIYEGIFGFSVKEMVKRRKGLKNSFKEFKNILSQVIRFYYDLRYLNFCHGNLKIENLYFDHQIVKIAGYELFKSEEEKMGFISGSFATLPFEMLNMLNYSICNPESNLEIVCSQKSDVWNLGVLCYEILTGEEYIQSSDPEFSTKTISGLLLDHMTILIERQNLLYSLVEPHCQKLAKLLAESLEPLPQRRPDLNQFFEYFSFPVSFSNNKKLVPEHDINQINFTENENCKKFKEKLIHEFFIIQFFKIISEWFYEIYYYFEKSSDIKNCLKIHLLSFVFSLSCLCLLKSKTFLNNLSQGLKCREKLRRIFPSLQCETMLHSEQLSEIISKAQASLANYEERNECYSSKFIERRNIEMGDNIKIMMSIESPPQDLSIIMTKMVIIFDHNNLHTLQQHKEMIESSLQEFRKYLESNEDLRSVLESIATNIMTVLEFVMNEDEKLSYFDREANNKKFDWFKDCFKRIHPNWNFNEYRSFAATNFFSLF